MKKIVGLLLTAVLVLGMSTVAFAAPSKSTTVSDCTTKEGAVITHAATAITTEVAKAAGIETKADGKMQIAATEVKKITETLKAANVVKADEKIQVLDVFNVEQPVSFDGNPIWISIPGVTWQEGLVVLHFQDGAWTALPTKNENGVVKAQFSKFSPTAIAIVEKATTSTGDVTAPKMGEGNTVVFAALGAVVATLAGCVVYRRKRA